MRAVRWDWRRVRGEVGGDADGGEEELMTV